MSYYYASPQQPQQAMNKYWIPHQDIHKKVITADIQYYLGPQATVRNYTKDGEDGFLITTPGECLTDEQIDDICLKSKEVWDSQVASRNAGDSDKTSKLKRPLHKPVVVSKSGSSHGSSSRGNGGESSSRRSHHSSYHDRRGHDSRRHYDAKGKERM